MSVGVSAGQALGRVAKALVENDVELSVKAQHELERLEKFLEGDPRKRIMLFENLLLDLELQKKMDGEFKKNPGAYARLGEVRLKGAEQRARILGVDLKKTVTGERLDTVNQIIDAAIAWQAKLAAALATLQETDPEGYSQVQKRLSEHGLVAGDDDED